MIDYHTSFGEDLWETTNGEHNPHKLIVVEKILNQARNNYCGCIFCALKGDERKNEEMIEEILKDYISSFENQYYRRNNNYINPISMVEIIMEFVYGINKNTCFVYYPESNNLTPLMKEMLNKGVSQNEMKTILEKFKYVSNDSQENDLPF